MIPLTRRNFIRGVATLPIALWVARHARAVAPVIRCDAGSIGGQEMLRVYADAVTSMQMRAAGDPLGWMWQWYTHFVGGATKADEITRIFAAMPTPQSALANEVWNTCQSHAGQNANYFLPWHRMFVFFFETIIRQVSGRPDFALPYWDYTSQDPAKRGVVPDAFRQPADPVFMSLYRPERSKLANTGQPIHKFQAGDPMDISAAMAAPAYSTVGSVPGFCRAIDSGIHGRIHVLVGTGKGMGAVPFAGRDPLFWVHHANIDRLWACWNRNGGVNPATASWADKQFVFADAQGQRVSGALKDYFDIATLGYTYDDFIAAPPVVLASNAKLAAQRGVPELVARAGSADLNASARAVALVPVAGSKRTAVLGLDPGQAAKRTYLVLRELHAWRQPEVLYHVYLTPSHAAAGASAAGYAGTINFFDAEFHDHGHGMLGDALGENFYSFDVTELLQNIARGGSHDASDGLQVSFVPGGRPSRGAGPLVGSIELVRQ